MPLEEKVQQQRRRHAGNDAAQGGRHGAGNAGDLQPDEGRGVDGQRAWRHLGNRDDIGKNLLGNPALVNDHLGPGIIGMTA